MVTALALAGGLTACAGLLDLDTLSPRPAAEEPDGAIPGLPDATTDVGATDAPATDAHDAFVPPPAPRILASKYFHTCAARTGGGLFCFGTNAHGELGDGTKVDRAVPTPVLGNPVVEDVATGLEHTCILQKGNVVSCWGSNAKFQLGDLTNTSRTSVGEAVQGSFTFVSAGFYHTCALTVGREVRCWGDNYYGVVGDGTRESRNFAARAIDSTGVELTDVISLATGAFHTCAAFTNGTVSCWGYNRYGELGYTTSGTCDGPEELCSLVPTTVPGIDHVVQVAAGYAHTCALRDDGTVWCWGANDQKALGDGTTVLTRIIPAPTVGALQTVVEIAAGWQNTCARLVDGTVRCWGRNDFGELGNGKKDPGTSVPDTPIFGLTGVTRLTTGDHGCAFDGNSALQCWGRNDHGQLGISTSGNSVLKPTVIPF